MLRTTAVVVSLGLLLSVSSFDSAPAPFAPTASAARPAPEAGLREDEVKVVLNDGITLTGTLLRETDDEVEIQTVFGKQVIPRSRIEQIIRVENAAREEFQSRYDRASKSKDVAALTELAEWASREKLSVEAQRAWERVIEIEPDHERAREQLGHARLDGKWLDRAAVEDLLRKGYVKVGLDLEKAEGATVTSDPESAVTRVKKTSAISFLASLSDAELRRRDSDAEKRESSAPNKLERYRRQKEEEHLGVDWSQKYTKKRGRYIIQCNSTEHVANVYLTIMNALYEVLQTRFTGRDIHLQKSPVNIYRTRDDFRRITGSDAGGFFRPTSKDIHAYHGVFGPTATTFAVLCHEGTHQFQALKLDNMMNLPAWLIEGMAVYFGDGSRLDPKKGTIITGLVPRDRLFGIQERMREGTNMRLRQLVELPYRGLNGALYADCWALTYFLFDGPEEKKRDGREFISRYWLHLQQNRARGKDFEILADRFYGGMDEMEKMVREYTLSLEPEPVGKIVGGDTLDSYDYKFKAMLPSQAGFEFRQGLLPNDALAGMVVPETETQILIHMRNKPFEQTDQEFIEARNKLYRERYGDFETESLELHGMKVPRLSFTTGSLVKKEDDDKEKDKEEEGEKTEPDEEKAEKEENTTPAEKPTNLKKWIYYYILPDRTYSLVCEAPASEFDAIAPYFERAAKDFEVMFENRW